MNDSSQLFVVASPMKSSGKKNEFQVVRVSDAFSSRVGEPVSEAWGKVLHCVTTASSVEDQMDAIKQISVYLTKSDDEIIDFNYVILAVDLYLSAPLKHPVKHALTKMFNFVDGHVKEMSILYLKEGINSRIETAMYSQDLSDILIASSALLGLYENFRLGPVVIDSMLCNVLQFLNKVLDLCFTYLRSNNTPMLKVEVSKVAHTVSRIIITAIQKPKSEILDSLENRKPLLENILEVSKLILNCSHVPLDTRTNFGFVLVLILDLLHGPNGWMQLLEGNESFPLDDEMSSLCICSGLLSGLKNEQFEIIHLTKAKPIISCILDSALQINERCVHESNLVLALWRVVQQLTRVLTMRQSLVKSLELPQLEDLLKHLWGLLDHYMDPVRHLAKSILENIMQLQDVFLSVGINLGDRMSEAVLLIPETKRSRYVILSTMTVHFSTADILNRIPNVIKNLLTAMQYSSMSSHVSGAFVGMATVDFKNLPYSEWCNLWVKPLLQVMQECNTSEAPALEESLSKIMKLCPKIINEVLPSANKGANVELSEMKLLLTCMKIGRKLGAISSKTKTDDNLWLGTLPVGVLQSALCHENDEVRISALGLVVETHRSTEILSQTDFMLLRKFLKYNINCEIPSFRQQTLALVTKLLNRLKESAHTLIRPTNQKRTEEGDGMQIWESYKTFLLWILSFCFDSLKIGSNYSRRFCSLKVLSFIDDILKVDPLFTNKTCQDQMWTEENAFILLGVILTDSFEENKAMATKFLVSYPLSTLGFDDNQKLFRFFQCGCTLASSTHPADCISAAYVMELCCCLYLKNIKIYSQSNFNSNGKLHSLELLDAVAYLQEQLKKESDVAERNILEAASGGPMYGSLFCIRHLLQLVPDFRKVKDKQSWQNLIKGLIDLCFKLNTIVSPVVNSSSPEGHLPMDFNQGSTLLGTSANDSSAPVKATAQMVLLCSWRTVKEVSLLLGKLSDCCPILPDTDGLLNEDQILAIGVHLTTLLEETKHRGAFEQAYVGFGLLASRLWRNSRKSLQELPQKWLSELMEAIQSDDISMNKLCATRRSAGVPYLVQALVSAELQTGLSLHTLQWTMSQLLGCAADKERHVECHTHALNILRALYRHAPLAEHVAPYISEGVIVAISGFRGETWAVRNSATLLFSSLMTRIFGVRRSREELSSRNKMTGRVFFHRYPELYEFLLKELEQAVKALTSGDVAELAILHPILLLIARLYPSSLEGTDTNMQLNTFVPLVRQCANNSVMKTRVLAAKAIVPLITANVYVKYLDDLVDQMASGNSENLTHGLALQAVHLLSNASILNEDHNLILLDHLQTWVAKLLLHLNRCCSNPVREVVLQVFELFLENWYSHVPLQSWAVLKDKILNEILAQDCDNLSKQSPLGQSILQLRATRVLLRLVVLAQDEDTLMIVSKLLRHLNYEIVHEILVVLEKLMGKGAYGLIEETEDVIPDVSGGDKHWFNRLPEDALLSFYNIICQSNQLGAILASLVTGSKSINNVQGRLALRVLVHVSPASWSVSVDLKKLLLWCDSPHEGTSCAALACFSSLLRFLIDSKEDIPLICEDGCRLLISYCDVDRGVISRLSAVNFLLLHRQALNRKYSFLSDETVCELWINALRLICDDNSEVRSKAGLLCQGEVPAVPLRSLEIMLDNFSDVMDSCQPLCLATLIAIALGPLPDSSNFEADEERIFDKAETNMFIEHEILTGLASQHILQHALKTTRLSHLEWKWIWNTIGGQDSENIFDAESLFDAVRKNNVVGLNLTEPGLLPPSVVVCSLRRLFKVEQVLLRETKVDPRHCLPFKYSQMWG
ncbi:thyroid adenoma-associated protein homolog [Thrips palmi]|uniref:tRNA (32-2'-O)-methyltransferase regulator THADA n=1 Tax=Thrips palmi TaxID=161013 RepID=A0A6P9A9J1_THRPL|nr:thyroid adenoma-associated protein homolog [Thrips palmi]